MTEQEIRDDRNKRADECKAEIESVLKKYEFVLTAEDNWTPNTKVKVEISFVDLKRYNAAVLAQPEAPTVAQLQGSTGGMTGTGQRLPEGVQSDGSVVINPDSLK